MIKPIIFTIVGACLASSVVNAETKPNIVFIFADDWGWGDLSCHGHPYVKTPHIDRLAKEGTDFTRFTVASGICSPSRAAVMTGHFPARYSIEGHFAFVESNAKRGMPDWLDTEAPTMPKMLQDAGYRTAHFGKWHLANNLIPDSPAPLTYGYDRAWAYNCSGEQLPVHDDVRESIDFIKKSHAEKKPFFINLWIHEPHTPFHTVPKWEWKFRHMTSREDQIYASVLSHADERIGNLLNTLDELKITDNTLVIFSSDNGPARNDRNEELALKYDSATGAGWGIAAAKGITGGRKSYKQSLFEGGVGVPFIARWPKKIPANKVDDTSLISAVDLLPTFCAIAGADMPKGYSPDGVDITAILKGDSMPLRDKPLFWKTAARYPAPKHKPDHWVHLAVVHGQWKLVASRRFKHVELYKIDSDVAEAKDLSKQEPEVTAKLIELLKQWLKELPDKPTGNVFSEERKELNK